MRAVLRLTLIPALLTIALGTARLATAQDAIILVRHAEKADRSDDTALSGAGMTRARRLARVLKDSGVTHIFTSHFLRTIQTGAPLAKAFHLTPTTVKAGDNAGLLAKIRAAGPQARVLVVGHTDTVPAILQALGVTTPITIPEPEFDNIFIVVPRAGASPGFVRLRY